ncbi:NAD(P)/FAD-dependent oxidoreductase [Myxococcota bacterium]|nr:NAD(P)/FAD-dependent oxidoreductase [Myxococcota bacterium]
MTTTPLSASRTPRRSGHPDVAVIGAGVVGLACAAEIAQSGLDVVVLEKHSRIGQETTSHNSEVIHAGIYYPVGSLKALTCVEGRDLLYARCQERRIPHRRIGKLIVATNDSEAEQLLGIRERALSNGAGAIEWLDSNRVGELEPRVRATAALWSPETGIVDSHALVASYQAELEDAGGVVALATAVTALERIQDGWRLLTQDGVGSTYSLEVGQVVNAAGLHADRVAEAAGIDVDAVGWRIRPCKGDYFSAAPSLGALTRHLVYPVPVAAGLGIHVTLDLAGRTRFGPDAEYVEEMHYRIDPAKAHAFARAVARYLPEIEPHDLQPEMAGLRPKLQGPGEDFRDFVVEESSHLGAPGIVHLVGIESPGLTASGALARRVRALICGEPTG